MQDEKQVREFLSRFRNTQIHILGIGSELKGDDGAGPLLCQKLKEADIRVEITDAGTVPENYIQSIVKRSPENILIIDAIDFSAPAGEIKIFTVEELSTFAFSTHALSPHLFIDMIKQQIDVQIYIIGIQPGSTGFGRELSHEVQRAVEHLIELLTETFSFGG